MIRRTLYSCLPAPTPAVGGLFHCCTWKTASQWVRLVLSDPRFYRATGLKPHHGRYILHGHSEQTPRTTPSQSVCTSMMIGHDVFEQLIKPDQWRAFFVVRDPRDLVVSRYHSVRYSHRPFGGIEDVRREMSSMTDEEGLLYTIDERFDRLALIIRSWLRATDEPANKGQIRIVRFEDLTGPDQVDIWCELLESLGVPVPRDTMKRVLAFYHHSKLRGPKSKKPGTPSKTEKYRSGKHGEWEDHFTDEVAQRFESKFGDLVSQMGYQA